MPSLIRRAAPALVMLAAGCATAPPPAPLPPPVPGCPVAPAAATGPDLQQIAIDWNPTREVFGATACLVVPGGRGLVGGGVAIGLLDARGALLGSGGQAIRGGVYPRRPDGGPINLPVATEIRASDPTAVTGRVLVRLQLILCEDPDCTAHRETTTTLVRDGQTGARPGR